MAKRILLVGLLLCQTRAFAEVTAADIKGQVYLKEGGEEMLQPYKEVQDQFKEATAQVVNFLYAQVTLAANIRHQAKASGPAVDGALRADLPGYDQMSPLMKRLMQTKRKDALFNRHFGSALHELVLELLRKSIDKSLAVKWGRETRKAAQVSFDAPPIEDIPCQHKREQTALIPDAVITQGNGDQIVIDWTSPGCDGKIKKYWKLGPQAKVLIEIIYPMGEDGADATPKSCAWSDTLRGYDCPIGPGGLGASCGPYGGGKGCQAGLRCTSSNACLE